MFLILLAGPLLFTFLCAAKTPPFPARVEITSLNTSWFNRLDAKLGSAPSIAPPEFVGQKIVCINAGPATCENMPHRDEMRAHTYVNWPACIRWACTVDPPHLLKVVAAEMPRDQVFDPANLRLSIIN